MLSNTDAVEFSKDLAQQGRCILLDKIFCILLLNTHENVCIKYSTRGNIY